MSEQVTVHEAKTNLSKLLARVEQGEEIVIARGAKPVAKLVQVGAAKKPREFGGDAGLFTVPDDFDEYWDEEIELIAEGGLDFDNKRDATHLHAAEPRAEYDAGPKQDHHNQSNAK